MQLSYEFIVVYDLVDEIMGESGKIEYHTIKKNARTRTTYFLSDICAVKEIINTRGTVKKTVCRIKHKEEGEICVLGSYNKIRDIVFDTPFQNSKIGFKIKR